MTVSKPCMLLTILSVLTIATFPEASNARSMQRAAGQAFAGRVERSFIGKARGFGDKLVRRGRHAAAAFGCRAIPSKCEGLRREAAAERILKSRYPSERVQSETYLVNRNGRPARDPKTGTARRIDFVLFNRGRVSRSYEVTSQYADKTAQLAKERRIAVLRRNGTRRVGPVYVRDRQTGGLVSAPRTASEVMRLK